MAEYLEHMHRNRWLMSVDFDFVSQYLVSGERFAYEGYTEGLKRTSLPPHIRAQAEEL